MTAEAADITIDHETDGTFTIVRPVGKLDTISAKSFEAYLKDLVDQKAGTLLVDMEKVDYVTSFGLRSLLIIAKLLAPSGDKLVLFQVNPSVLDVLKISGFLKILTVQDTLDAAMEFAGQAG
ncbi:STAS domain-containing protein [Roseibium sp.]|uniref:STAS domain-containing protein n=1 Tax=Roseibium sp. TaxID=1936156 RepID=UPI003BAFB870